MQKQSATIVYKLEVNSLTENEIDKLAAKAKITKNQMAAFILSQGFSNLLRKAPLLQRDSFCTKGFSNPITGGNNESNN